MGHQLKQWVIQRRQTFIGFLLFATALWIYMANNRYTATSDTLPNSLLALNWLRYHTFNFDAFRDSYEQLPWFLVEAPNGHLTSTYPIGTAIVTFPIYFLLSIYIKCINLIQTGNFSFPVDFPNIADPAFHEIRLRFQKQAAAIATALSVVIFYQATRIKFSEAIALITTFTFAFCTLTWVVSSQILWQHTASNLVLIAAILALFKVNRTEGLPQKGLLIAAGFFCGLLPGIRPTGALFAIAIFLYIWVRDHKQVIWFCLGLPSVFLNLAWNFYYFGFGNLIGGYSNQFATGQSGYEFTLPYFIEACLGLTLSPSRGLLIISPILLFAIPGAIYLMHHRSHQDEQLMAGLTIAAGILWLQYCFYKPWFGRAPVNFGPRFLTDLLPIAVYLINYPAAFWLQQQASRWKQLILVLFLTATCYSALVQTAGAFGNHTSWELIPYSHAYRLWDGRDSEIQRSMRSLWYRITNPIKSERKYQSKLDGVIEQITDRHDRPLTSALAGRAGKKQYLKAKLRNTGKADWFGYETGMQRGITQVNVELRDRHQHPMANFTPGILFVSGNHQSGETAAAIGLIQMPQQTGEYQLYFKLAAGKIGDFPQVNGQSKSEYRLPLTVK